MIGTAGTRYFKDPANKNIYTSTIGRPDKGNVKFTDESDLMIYFDKARRIEMRPSSDPEMQQLVVGSNGSVRRFRATFEHRCKVGAEFSGLLVGEVSLNDPPLVPAVACY